LFGTKLLYHEDTCSTLGKPPVLPTAALTHQFELWIVRPCKPI